MNKYAIAKVKVIKVKRVSKAKHRNPNDNVTDRLFVQFTQAYRRFN